MHVLSEHGMKIAPQNLLSVAGLPGPPEPNSQEAYLVNQIVDLYRTNRCVYGVRKMWHAARRAGLHLGRDQVGLLMRIAGIQGVRRGAAPDDDPRPVTSRAARHPDLVKRGWKHAEPPGRDLGRGLHVCVDGVRIPAMCRSSPMCTRGGSWGGGASMSKTSDLASAALAAGAGHAPPGEQASSPPKG